MSARHLLVVQSGGPTAVLNATLAGILQAWAGQPAAGRVYGAIGGFAGALQGALVDLTDLPPEEREALKVTPGAVLGSGRYQPGPGDVAAIRDLCRARGIRYVLFIGGNGSMLTPLALGELAGADLRVIGVPKTVDNDLLETDHSPGYPSAARYVALAVQDAGADLATMAGFDGVKVVEIMGRNAGWLTAAALLAPPVPGVAPPIALVPEQPVDTGDLLQRIAETHRRYGHVLIAASEGARDATGALLAAAAAPLERDALGRPIYGQRGGAGEAICRLVAAHLGLPARYDKPGTLQRGAACAAPVDRDEAVRVGESAVAAALAGATGVMIRLVREPGAPYRCRTGTVPLAQVAGRERLLPPEFFSGGQLRADAIRAYAGPLVGDLPRFAAFAAATDMRTARRNRP